MVLGNAVIVDYLRKSSIFTECNRRFVLIQHITKTIEFCMINRPYASGWEAWSSVVTRTHGIGQHMSRHVLGALRGYRTR
jgi:hypothetical protein